MAEERITITIDQDGQLRAETSGFRGDVCMAELEQLLGDLIDIQKVTKTDEFYQPVQMQNKIKSRL